MNTDYKSQLESELKDAGETQAEVNELLQLSGQLHGLAGPAGRQRSESFKLELARQIIATTEMSHRWRPWLGAMGVAMALFGGILVASIAPNSNPGDLSYGLKRVSEQVAVTVQPGYRDQMMMHRSEEVRHLIDVHADSKLVASTVDSYIYDVSKTTPGSYHALEYCAKILEDAKAKASSTDARSIEDGLKAARMREQKLTT